MDLNTKKIAIVIVVLQVILIVLVATTININTLKNKNEIDLSQLTSDQTKGVNKLLEKQKVNQTEEKETENIVFLGDSITEIYPIYELYDDVHVVKSGVSGYGALDILDRMDNMVYKYNPTKVFLLIGTNDIASDISKEKQEKTIKQIEEIITNLNKKRPNAKVYVESIYPVNRNMDKKMVAKRENEVIQSMNKKIKQICKEKNITYINMYDELTDKDGNFDEKLTYDGLHPSELGFAKITKVLFPYIYEE